MPAPSSISRAEIPAFFIIQPITGCIASCTMYFSISRRTSSHAPISKSPGTAPDSSIFSHTYPSIAVLRI
ncbi:MAG: hypothetical protein ACLT8E_00985 [Akkermansia sp.]